MLYEKGDDKCNDQDKKSDFEKWIDSVPEKK